MAVTYSKPSANPSSTRRLNFIYAFLIFITSSLIALAILWYSDAHTLLSNKFPSFNNPSNLTAQLDDLRASRHQARSTPGQWLSYLRASTRQNASQTVRLGCREYVEGAQACTYEGFICVNTSQNLDFARPLVYFLDQTEVDRQQVPSDSWCNYRFQSANPRYYGNRHWPIMNNTFAPQGSCLDAYYRTERSLLGNRLKRDPSGNNTKIKWLPSMWLVDLDYVNNNHNNHLFMDIIWMLDVLLWQQSVDSQPPPGLSPVESEPAGKLFSDGPRHVYLPQGEKDFIAQTSRDVNRFLYALILQLDLSRLYPNHTKHQIRTPPKAGETRLTAQLLDAYPNLRTDEQLLFHRNIRDDDDVDLVCAPRFSTGAKMHNAGHERVCRVLRQRSLEFFGVEEPEMRRIGQAYYPQPPKRIVILQRHITRGIANVDALEKALGNAFRKYNVDIEVVATESVSSAEEHVRVFSNAGVIITSHGSQSMGQIWMPRHSALIEIMPVGYTDYAFLHLSESCKVWHYELRSKLRPEQSKKDYYRECGRKVSQVVDPCNNYKSEDVWVDVEKAVSMVKLAMERMGHTFGPWLKDVEKGS